MHSVFGDDTSLHTVARQATMYSPRARAPASTPRRQQALSSHWPMCFSIVSNRQCGTGSLAPNHPMRPRAPPRCPQEAQPISPLPTGTPRPSHCHWAPHSTGPPPPPVPVSLREGTVSACHPVTLDRVSRDAGPSSSLPVGAPPGRVVFSWPSDALASAPLRSPLVAAAGRGVVAGPDVRYGAENGRPPEGPS